MAQSLRTRVPGNPLLRLGFWTPWSFAKSAVCKTTFFALAQFSIDVVVFHRLGGAILGLVPSDGSTFRPGEEAKPRPAVKHEGVYFPGKSP